MIGKKVYNLFSLGMIGSSVASMLLIGLFNSVLVLWSIRDGIWGIKITGLLIWTAMATAAMTTVIIFVSLNNLFLYVIMGMMIYFVVFVAIGGISKIDLGLFRHLLTKDESRRLNFIFDFTNKLLRI